MTDSNVINLNKPEQNDPLQEVLREGARKLLAAAIEAEVAAFIARHSALKTDADKAAVVRNGYLPERSIQTGLGDIEVKVPKVRDRSGSGIKFNSSLVPPYLKRTKNIEEFLPWLYLRGISTGDFSEMLKHLLGPDAPGLSAATISRLKQDWEQDYQDWTKRDLSQKRYVYVWADGVYSHVRLDSKGKEADYVVVLGLEKGKHGFPSEKATHPLLELLLPKAEAYEYAEERRLFYVALTRARHHVYLITDGNNPSQFVRELIDKRYPILTDEFTGEGFQDQLASIPCSRCQIGYMVPRDSRYGSFFGCSQYPLCDHTQHACQWCGSGLQHKGQFRVCENPRCDFVEPICPRCGGTLNLRTGPHGQFWGCSNYRKAAEFSCAYKEKFIDLQAARRP